jgi:ABC-type sugar transport system ATPase subunit
MAGSGLEFRDVSKSFGAVRALSAVSFVVTSGEAHAVVGENGAGKSTLLKILAGIVRPDQGSVRLNDTVIDCHSPREALEHGVGMVYQRCYRFNLTVSGKFLRAAKSPPH